MSTELLKLEIDLRQAAELRRFDEMLVRSVAFCEAVKERLSVLSPSDPERRVLAEKVQDTLAWCLRRTSQARDEVAAECRRLSTLNGYLGGQAIHPSAIVRAEL